jgi:hypothetical protein
MRDAEGIDNGLALWEVGWGAAVEAAVRSVEKLAGSPVLRLSHSYDGKELGMCTTHYKPRSSRAVPMLFVYRSTRSRQ